MKINTDKINPTFGIIELKPKDKRVSKKLMNAIIANNSVTEEKNKFALKLYRLFEPYINEEGKLKARTRYSIEDVISDIKLKFWEFIYGISDKSSLDNLIQQINDFKPFKSSLKPEKDNYSLDAKVWSTDKVHYIDNVTKENLPVPQSEIEVEKNKQIIKNSIQKTKMTPQTKKRIKKISKGLKYSEIARNENVTLNTIIHSVNKGILQIQKRTGTISPENQKNILNIAQILDITYDKAIDILIKYIEILSITPERLNYNIETTSKLFGIKRTDFIKAALKNPTLLYRKPETLNNNADKFSELFGISRADFIKIGLNMPVLFTRNPETLYSNAEESAKIFGVSKADFIKIALKEFRLFNKKPETLNKNAEASAQLLGIPKKDYINAALKHSPLFYQKPETINTNTESSAKLFGISKEDFTRAALQRPTLFSRTPKNLYENVKSTAKLLGIPMDSYVKVALKQPALFYLKYDTINENIESSARLLGISKKEMLENAIKSPQLFYMKPETLSAKSRIVRYYNRELKKNSQNLKLLTYISKSESTLYKEMLFHLIRKSKILKNVTNSQIETKLSEYANSSHDPLTFVIPKADFIQSFLEFARNYSIKTTGKNIFNFVVIEHSAK